MYHPDVESTGSEVPLDPELLFKIQSSVLKDEGCFITSRMLCRRYSALFKVHHVVHAMQEMVLPPDDERHIGVFKFINERTKVWDSFIERVLHVLKRDSFGFFSHEVKQ